jgi:hypothetical protein
MFGVVPKPFGIKPIQLPTTSLTLQHVVYWIEEGDRPILIDTNGK